MFSGQTPVWVHLYARFRRADSTYRTQQAPRTRYGWRVKALWLVHRDQREPVAVSIAEVRTQRRILFKIGAAKTRRPVLDPTRPGHPDDPRKPDTHEWGSYLYFPKAGCYVATASVPGGGGWSFTFGFGR
jgi:hypothetical protein